MRVVIKQRARTNVRLKATTFASAGKASQSEAEGGTDNQHYLTPLGGKQQTDARLASVEEAEAATDNEKLLTPATGNAALAANAPPLINERISRPQAFRRKLFCEVALTAGVVQDALTAAGHDWLAYPTGLAINKATNDLWTTHSFNTSTPGVSKGVICWWNVTNPAAPTLRTWFYSGHYSREGLHYREINGRRYLYMLGDSKPIRMEITTQPTAGSTITYDGTYSRVFTEAPDSYYEIAYLGSGAWAYMLSDIQNPGGLRVKQQWATFRESGADGETWTKTGNLNFPLGAIGSYFGNIQLLLPKVQGAVFWRGQFVMFAGGDYRPAAGGSSGDRTLMAKQQGLVICSPNGDFVDSALCDPAVALALTGQMVGRSITVHENEGGAVDATDDKPYAGWQVLTPGTEGQTTGRSLGFVITEEVCAHDTALDYSGGGVGVQRPFDQRSRHFAAQYGVAITHPITGAALTTASSIADMQIECSLLDYDFSGYNNTITDLNGDAIPLSNGFATAKIAVNSAWDLTVEYPGGGSWRMRIATLGGIGGGSRVQTIAPVRWSASNILYGGGASPTVDPVASAVDGYSLDPAGIYKAHRGASTAMSLGRGTTDGYILTCSRSGSLVGGLNHYGSTVRLHTSPTTYFGVISGSPEGVAGGSVGSILVNTANGAVYRKTSGSGNTGWTTP